MLMPCVEKSIHGYFLTCKLRTMTLTPEESCALLLVQLEKDLHSVIDNADDVINNLVQKGLIYLNPSTESLFVTKSGKHRINNHITKERNIPDYITKYSFGEAFNKFFSTASPAAVNALLLALLNSKKLSNVNPITLSRLMDACNEELNTERPSTKVNLVPGKVDVIKSIKLDKK